MYKKTDKRRIYWLIDKYLSGTINAKTFCDEYYYCYCLELDSDTLTEAEINEFSKLDVICGRFSECEEDAKPSRGGYYTEKELKPVVIEAQEKLKTEQINLNSTFDPNDKRKLYWLINQYLLETIDTQTFCDEFVGCYNWLDTDLLTKTEYHAFANLNPVAGYFSKFKDDFKQCANTSYTQEDLTKKVLETKELLNQEKSYELHN